MISMDIISENEDGELIRKRHNTRRGSLAWERFYFDNKAYKSSPIKSSPVLGTSQFDIFLLCLFNPFSQFTAMLPI